MATSNELKLAQTLSAVMMVVEETATLGAELAARVAGLEKKVQVLEGRDAQEPSA